MGTFKQTPAEELEETRVHFNRSQNVLESLQTFRAEERGKAKDIWDNVKMILEGSELTKDDRESQLYDEFERFCQIKGETIHVYYVRFITEVKLNRGLKESNFDQLYAYLKQHEVHANENIMMMERFIQPTNDPLALVSNASVQQYPTQSSESPQFSNQPSLVDNCQMDTGSTSMDNLIESLTNTLALLRTSSNARNKATDSDYFKDKMLLINAHENGAVLDEEQLLFLTGEQVTNFDDDADDLALNCGTSSLKMNNAMQTTLMLIRLPPHRTMFMKNLSS
ncbi:hypothetical protein Tco_0153557 [Tanacetum coccineum]